MKTLYLHIGTPKTGTSSIQTFCKKNKELLEKIGYTYPVFSFVYPGVPATRNGHFLVGTIMDEEGKRCTQEEQRVYKEGIEKVKELFAVWECVVLSEENIWRSSDVERKDLWESLKQEAEQGGFAVKIVVYLRRQDELLCSLWNQQIKSPKASIRREEPFADYVKRINKKIRFDYYGKLKKIAEVFGQENVIVRRFGKEYFLGGTIYTDFLNAIGITDTDAFQMPDSFVNQSLYGNDIEIKRILNSLPQTKDVEIDDFFSSGLRSCSEISKQKYSCSIMSKEEIERFLEPYEEGNQRVAEEFLKDGEPLFDDTIRDIPKWQPDNPYMYEDIIRFMGMNFSYLLEENKALHQEISEMKDKLKHPLRTLIQRSLAGFQKPAHKVSGTE